MGEAERRGSHRRDEFVMVRTARSETRFSEMPRVGHSRVSRGFALVSCWLTATGGLFGQGESASKAAWEYQQGRTSFEAARYAEAAGHFEKAMAEAPSSLCSQWLGRAYGLEAKDASLFAKPGLANRSREALERAVALDPDNVGARSDLAAFYQAAPSFMGGGLAKAQAQVAEIRQRDPYLGQVRAGDLLADDHHEAEAERAYDAAVTMDAHRTEAHERLGFSYAESGRYPQAFAQWDELLRNNPTQLHALYGLGKTAALSGQRTEEGEAALRSFVATAKPDPAGPTLTRAHFYLGRLLARRGDGRARAEYEAALQLNPKMNEARQAIKDLRH